MNTQEITHKARAHPIMIIAAIAVVVFCGVGTAAVMGWLPSSNANGSALAPVAATASLPPGVSNASNAANAGGQNPVTAPNTQTAMQEQAPVRDAQPVAATCSSCGVVQAVREVHHRGQGTGAGAAGGAILGGLLGNQIGSGHGRQLATVAGAVGGAVAGNQVEGNMRTTTSYEIVVRMNSGATRTFHQSALPAWREGGHVEVVNGHLRSE